MAKKRKRRRPNTPFQLALKALGFKSYAAYLKSDHWLHFRERYFAKHKKVCYCCAKDARDLHHTTYEFIGKERLKDVKPLCRDCHDKVHTLIKKHRVPLSEAHEVLVFVLNG